MQDNEIIALYFSRDERAISETQSKYGAQLRGLARRILYSSEDAEECENDTYMQTWNTIPPKKPSILAPYIFTICRRFAIGRQRKRMAEKRGSGQSEYTIAYDELSDVLSDGTAEDPADTIALREALDGFLSSLEGREKTVFLRRYYYLCPLKDIARDCSMGESAVKMTLQRLREKLKKQLISNGFEL